MEREKWYDTTFFSAQTVKEGIEKFFNCIGIEKEKNIVQIFQINYGNNSWKFEDEKEFFIDYKPGIYIANLHLAYLIEGGKHLSAFVYIMRNQTHM